MGIGLFFRNTWFCIGLTCRSARPGLAGTRAPWPGARWAGPAGCGRAGQLGRPEGPTRRGFRPSDLKRNQKRTLMLRLKYESGFTYLHSMYHMHISGFYLSQQNFISDAVCSRVARWYIFKPKISIRVNFLRSCNGRYWYILRPFGIFCGY
jgi:hypothetical protein